MAKTDKKKEEKEIQHTEFKMQTRDGKKTFNVLAPDDSLDKDGNAESALAGIYRKEK